MPNYISNSCRPIPASETGRKLTLPYLSRLTARLLGLPADRTVVEFRMGGVVRMERDDAGRWVIVWAVFPELLEPRCPDWSDS